MNITVRCTTCYPMRLGDCPDTLDFAISVTANTEYAYELCDSQGNIYEGETTTNGSGNVSISTSDVPFDAYPGLFNKWAGSFKLTLYDADGDAVPFTVAGTEYTCIAFSFRETVELDNCNNEISCGCLTGGYAFPSDLIGQDGDFYIVETTGVILEKVDGAWTVFFVPISSAGIADGDYGDITVSGAGTVWTIDNQAVTFAKMQNISTDKLLGRDTVGSGNVEEIGLNSTLEFDGAGNLQRAALTGDVTASAGSNATTIANDAVTNAKLANMATQTIKGRTTAGTGDPEDLTATQATAILNAMVGDSGAGGTKGLVPAPAAGDAAAGKYLKANGAWETPAVGSSGKCIWVGSYNIITSAAGIGYNVGTPIYLAALEVPLGTIGVASGDIIHVHGMAQTDGSGNVSIVFELGNAASRISVTETYGAHGATNVVWTGVNYHTYLRTGGDFWDPAGGASFGSLVADQYAATSAASSGFTQAGAGSGQIDYSQSIWLHCWAYAANTRTVYFKDMIVKIYRP